MSPIPKIIKHAMIVAVALPLLTIMVWYFWLMPETDSAAFGVMTRGSEFGMFIGATWIVMYMGLIGVLTFITVGNSKEALALCKQLRVKQ